MQNITFLIADPFTGITISFEQTKESEKNRSQQKRLEYTQYHLTNSVVIEPLDPQQ